jgi:hypothetical protein
VAVSPAAIPGGKLEPDLTPAIRLAPATSPESSTLPTTVLVIGGLAAAGVIAFLALK